MTDKILSRDEILKADDLKRELVKVPEWGGSVFVRMLTGSERDQFEVDILQSNGKEKNENLYNLRAALSALCIVDEAGAQLFNSADVRELGKKSAHALQRVFDAAMKLNALTSEEVEELAGNSESDLSDDSGSS